MSDLPFHDLPAHLVRGRQTRDRILDHTLHVATCEGLDAITIGRVAKATGLAKASVLGHYASKEVLQLATLECGRQQFAAAVVARTTSLPEGLPHLAGMLDAWVDHVVELEGGCLFASVATEYDARHGLIRDQIKELVREWLRTLGHHVDRAKALGQLRPEVDTEQLTFRLYGVELAMNLHLQLFGDHAAVERARAEMRTVLGDAATPAGLALL